MKGDFTRDTFDPARGFTRVLMQQGRVQLDADWNEQASIFHHFLRSLAKDLIGPHGGPAGNVGFQITRTGEEITIGPGTYYVDGLRCETSGSSYGEQPYFHHEPLRLPTRDSKVLVYLDVWERHVTHVEYPSIREVALLGPDTAARAQLVWQVKSLGEAELGEEWRAGATLTPQNAEDALRTLQRSGASAPMLTAFAQKPEANVDPCKESPDARYRGMENQLYRVEIHEGGPAARQAAPRPGEVRIVLADGIEPAERIATFKWSRENGSVVFPVEAKSEGADGKLMVTLQHLGRDPRFSLKEGDWVEWVHENGPLAGEPGPLLRVLHMNATTRRVTLEQPEGPPLVSDLKNAFLRRWDQRGNTREKDRLLGGAMPVFEEQDIPLENGIAIRFKKGATYRTGDYWLIPARTATGDVEWPKDEKKNPQPSRRHGPEHHYAPLALLTVEGGEPVADLRMKYDRLAKPM